MPTVGAALRGHATTVLHRDQMHTSAGRVPSVYRGATHARRATARPLVVARSTGADDPKRRRSTKAQKEEVPKEVVTPDIMALSFDAGSFDEPPAGDSKAPKKKPTRRKRGSRLRHEGSAAADDLVAPLDELFGASQRVALRSIPSPSPSPTGGRLVTIDEGSYDNTRNLVATKHKRHLMMLNSMPRVLLVHTGGTLGMDPQASYTIEEDELKLREATGGAYKSSLVPADVLADLMSYVPELSSFANLEVKVPFNVDSSRVGPKEWTILAKLLHENRAKYDAFLIVHGTDTMAYTASALSIMLSGFAKPIIMTGSQLPLLMPRSDARQNLIDSITVATAGFSHPYVHLNELAVCFGGVLMRGNRAQKTNSTAYQAFGSPSYPLLAELGVEIDWKEYALLEKPICYQPRFNLNTNVIRDPRVAYGDLYGRGVRGIVLEAFGLGNMPDLPAMGWMPWLRTQRKKGMAVYLASQCLNGDLAPELYRSGALAMEMGVQSGPKMTPECAVVKTMLCLAYPDLHLTAPLAGEL